MLAWNGFWVSVFEFIVKELGGYQRALGFGERSLQRRVHRKCRKGSLCLPPLPGRTCHKVGISTATDRDQKRENENERERVCVREREIERERKRVS